jgi:hypothetical protein
MLKEGDDHDIWKTSSLIQEGIEQSRRRRGGKPAPSLPFVSSFSAQGLIKRPSN